MLFGFDLQGAITLIAGALLALITLYGLRPTSSTPDMTMSTSFGAQPSSSISKGCCDQSAYLSSLPRWRRWLSRLNWHPVVELEIREIEFERRKIEFDNRKIEHENRRIEHEKRIKQLESEIARLEQANSRLARFEQEHLSGSIPPPSTGDSYS